MKTGDPTWRLAAGTALLLLSSVAATGMWVGSLQQKVTSLEAEAAQTRVQLMTKLDQIETRLVELQLALRQEQAEQRIYHRGQAGR